MHDLRSGMKDVTTTSFGLIIAYLLPGMVGLYSLTSWSPELRRIFGTFLTAESNIGLFFLVVLAALVVGLLVNSFRWLLYERWICRVSRLNPVEFGNLGVEGRLAAYRVAIDENFRYSQFSGSMSVVFLLLYVGWLKDSWGRLSYKTIGISFLVLFLVELVTVLAAKEAYERFVARSRRILEGG